MPWTDESLAAHVTAWQACTLPRDAWAPHESHVATTVWHLRRYAFGEALKRMREGILAYNTAHGIADRYHETVTVVYTHLIADAARRLDRGQGISALAQAVIDEMGMTREQREALWRRYYRDPAVLWEKGSPSRTSFIPPDLQPLPTGPA